MGFLSRKSESPPRTTGDQAVGRAMVTSNIEVAAKWAKNNAKSLGYGPISDEEAKKLAVKWGIYKKVR